MSRPDPVRPRAGLPASAVTPLALSPASGAPPPPDPESHPAVLLQDLGGDGCSGASGLAQGHPASCGDRRGRLSRLQPWGTRLGVPFPGSSPHPLTVVLPRVSSAPGGGSVRAGRWGGLVWANRRLAVEVRVGDRLPSTWGAPLSPSTGGMERALPRLPGMVWTRRGPGGPLQGRVCEDKGARRFYSLPGPLHLQPCLAHSRH